MKTFHGRDWDFEMHTEHCPTCGTLIEGVYEIEFRRQVVHPNGILAWELTGLRELRANPCGHGLAHGTDFHAVKRDAPPIIDPSVFVWISGMDFGSGQSKSKAAFVAPVTRGMVSQDTTNLIASKAAQTGEHVTIELDKRAIEELVGQPESPRDLSRVVQVSADETNLLIERWREFAKLNQVEFSHYSGDCNCCGCSEYRRQFDAWNKAQDDPTRSSRAVALALRTRRIGLDVGSGQSESVTHRRVEAGARTPSGGAS